MSDESRKLRLFFGCVAIAYLASAVGSLFTFDAIDTWYAGLSKPSFSPPDSYFAPVWTLLYFLIGAALFVVVKDGISDHAHRKAIIVFGIQLFFNAFWSVAFFGWKNIFGGLVVIVTLWILIAMNILYFSRIDRRAGMLLVPYFLWVSFAAVLNYGIWVLN